MFVCLFVFFLQHNAINTGKNGKTAKLPKAKLDFGRRSFYFLGASTSLYYKHSFGMAVMGIVRSLVNI